MKIYKFRSLATQKDFDRTKNILETRHFWCSKFSELNDPMEGAFHAPTRKIVNEAFEQKMRYKICSFSGENAFKNPALWGYYANGFRGIAIEVECEEKEVEKINYIEDIKSITNDESVSNNVKEILTTKLNPWKHEEEYRFLKAANNDFHKIGKITAIYFGNPYNKAVNKNNIYGNNNILNKYKDFRENLIQLISNMYINHYDVRIEGIEVKAILNK